ncbi:hypothetical protein [Haloarcula sp. 1CSR25-25]|jgi:hypothetical protein|uniref:hypothetical protein n=1 Tax=Haloarcula sp. 1CSR25-25 TaxID=2862545 RepID=UPI0028938625|nr:hypothetical protein [Haloarcula sp. 1CSR25-25]MDT3437806.1 hypothetical protein [Haloarcula sp. 1CSR25-25]
MFEQTEQSDSRVAQQFELPAGPHTSADAAESVIIEDQDDMDALADDRFFEAERQGPSGKVSTRFEYPDQG